MKTLHLLILPGLCIALAACNDKVGKLPDADPAPVPITNNQSPSATDPRPALDMPPELAAWSGNAGGQPNELCSLDAVNGLPPANGQLRAQFGASTTFEGWIATPKLDAPERMTLFLDGSEDFKIDGKTGVQRTDVADALGKQALKAGFEISLVKLRAPPGNYVVLVGQGEGATICKTQATLKVE